MAFVARKVTITEGYVRRVADAQQSVNVPVVRLE